MCECESVWGDDAWFVFLCCVFAQCVICTSAVCVCVCVCVCFCFGYSWCVCVVWENLIIKERKGFPAEIFDWSRAEVSA